MSQNPDTNHTWIEGWSPPEPEHLPDQPDTAIVLHGAIELWNGDLVHNARVAGGVGYGLLYEALCWAFRTHFVRKNLHLSSQQLFYLESGLNKLVHSVKHVVDESCKDEGEGIKSARKEVLKLLEMYSSYFKSDVKGRRIEKDCAECLQRASE